MTHYDVLGVASDATYTEIKSKYRSLVKRYHPDVNDSEEAKELIVQITEAYDVLSDPVSRQQYDWQLGHGRPADPVYEQPPQPTPEQLYKQEYIRKKRQREQELWQQRFHIRAKFYKVQRIAAFLFLIMSLVFMVDYYFTPVIESLPIARSGTNYFNCVVRTGRVILETDKGLCMDIDRTGASEIRVHESGVFHMWVGVSVDNGYYHKLEGTLHVFNNFFTFLLLAISVTIIYHKKYNELVLTLGLLSYFIALFMFIMVA